MNTALKTVLCFAVIIFSLNLTKTATAYSLTIEVPGTASIWLANQPGGTEVFLDVAPTNSPVAIDVASVNAGSFLYFDVSGTTSRDPNLGFWPLVGGDGETPGTGGFAVENWSFPPQFDLSGMTGPVSSLVAVFIDLDQVLSTPSNLYFGDASSRSFTDLSPSIQQVFFIGDGLTGVGVGELQMFQVPLGADLLYLGLLDGGNYNNVGALYVTVDAVPLPASFLLLGSGFFVLERIRRGKKDN